MEDTLSLHGELRVVEHVPRAFAALVVEEAPASLALSGGSTARKCYELLAGAELDWSEVDVFFGDELHPHPRLTLTFPALNQSRLAVFTVAGEGKREALQRVKSGDDLPAARVSAARVIWLIDEAANG